MNIYASAFFIILYLLSLAILTYLIFKKKWYKLNHENLFSQKLFWISTLTPALSFIYFGIFSWIGHKPQFDSSGMDNFLNISKFPLLCLATAVPLGAIVSNLHRTYQVEAQIKSAERKNILDSFYSHYKFYTESFSKINIENNLIHTNIKSLDDINSLKIKIWTPHTLYRRFFPNSSQENGVQYTVDPESIKKMNTLIKNVLSSINKIKEQDISEMIKENSNLKNIKLNEIKSRILKLSYYFCFIEDIQAIEIFNNKEKNKTESLYSNFIRLRILNFKIQSIILKILDVVEIKEDEYAELYSNIKKLRSGGKEQASILSKRKKLLQETRNTLANSNKAIAKDGDNMAAED